MQIWRQIAKEVSTPKSALSRLFQSFKPIAFKGDETLGLALEGANSESLKMR